MKRAACSLALLTLVLIAGCATPEVAEEHREKTLVPREIEEALRSDDPTLRAEAARQIETLLPERAKEVLLELSRDGRAQTRLLAVNLLGRKHATDAGVVLRFSEMISLDSDADIRSAAVHALAGSGRIEGLAAILDALTSDASLAVKRDAALVLDKLTGKSFGREAVRKIEGAEMAADDAMMSYDEWFQASKASLRWDAGRSRFELGR